MNRFLAERPQRRPAVLALHGWAGLLSPRRVRGLARRLGVGGVRVYLARASRREVIVACVETGNPEAAFRGLVASEEPFDEWFKERLTELHGYEPGRRTGSPPELIFEHPGNSGGP